MSPACSDPSLLGLIRTVHGMLRAQQLILAAFSCSFKVPKFHVMKDFGRAIRDLGCTEVVSTEYGEGTHRVVKAAYPFNNRHPRSMLKQVCG